MFAIEKDDDKKLLWQNSWVQREYKCQYNRNNNNENEETKLDWIKTGKE